MGKHRYDYEGGEMEDGQDVREDHAEALETEVRHPPHPVLTLSSPCPDPTLTMQKQALETEVREGYTSCYVITL